MNSIETLPDSSKNVLHVRYRGNVTAAIMDAHLQEIGKVLPLLSKGFILATDLSELDRIDLDSSTALMKVMDQIRESGVGTVARLIPNPEKDIGFSILSQFHYPPEVRIFTCETPEEFTAILEEDA